MTAGPDTPGGWSYAEPPPRSKRPGLRRTRVLAATTAVIVTTVAVLAVWVLWPSPPPAAPAPVSKPEARPLLDDQPPTVILNGLDARSLYPPGYVDFDLSQDDSDPDDVGYDPNTEYKVTSEPPGCGRDPVLASSNNVDNRDPDRYDRYPVMVLMYPVDDPGGNTDDTAFSVVIWPAPNPDSLKEFRDYFDRCRGANLTATQTLDGRVVSTETATLETIVGEAPTSNAVDSFTLGDGGEDVCNFIGLARGLIVQVNCPNVQKNAGVNLFRAVIDRINDI